MKNKTVFSLNNILKGSSLLLKLMNREIDQYDNTCAYMAALDTELNSESSDFLPSHPTRQEKIEARYRYYRKKYQNSDKKELETAKELLEERYQRAKIKKEE